jgi:hypothetical protein
MKSGKKSRKILAGVYERLEKAELPKIYHGKIKNFLIGKPS